ncbi:substrate-binding domain-containing protein [Paenibacillus endoradicis]|uniref:substrate-binding domain-containing protein n=1 Tax=Paenibacillus endoradicis TaxID=2972487 RepID=UPI0021597E6E|nr:substrate-binding domain-containing protein [Paenibacillus endoradicis]MCR8660187.1 substrate-binding domain-containing protein [Paenibacillus endoradicis]
MHQIMDMKDRPTAVFTGSDEVAAGIIMEARNQGVNIPEELAVVGFDDQPLAQLLTPELTTIKQPVSEMGHKAMDLLIQSLSGTNVENKMYTLQHELVIRKTT